MIFCLVVLSASNREKTRSDTDLNPEEMHVFLLMGQSNMSGYGELLPEDSVPVESVFVIPTISETPYDWMPAAHPLHNRLPTDRFGLGLSFAKAYLESHPNTQVGLIPLAWGGAGIDQLNKGTEVYRDALSKAAFAKKNGIIKGILWHQGESDSVTEILANSYEKKLHALINDLRLDLGIADLPVIVGDLAEFYGTGNDHCDPQRVKQINIIKKVLRDLPSKIDHTGFVESSGCASIDQHMVHFDRNSYIILGERYAAQIEKTQKK